MNVDTLKLFKSIKLDKVEESAELNKELMKSLLNHGIVLSPNLYHYINNNPADIDVIRQYVGISSDKLNNTFQKDWNRVQNTDQEILWLEAVLHYASTYGSNLQGDDVYAPYKELDIPSLDSLIFIKSISSQDLNDKVISLVNNNLALSEDVIKQLFNIIITEDYDSNIVDLVNNRELKSMLMEYYDIVPGKPEEFLRYVIYKVTGQTLVIKNTGLIDLIKLQSNQSIINNLDKLMSKAPTDLPSIFYRFKPLFLALKSISDNKLVFNQLRRRAVKQHKPAKESYLNTITSKIKLDEPIDLDILSSELAKADVFKKVKLANALSFRLTGSKYVNYIIRSGKSFSTSIELDESKNIVIAAVLNLVVKSITDNINIDKPVFIPSYINYGLPSSQRQFIGNIPLGSRISMDSDMILGVQWDNVGSESIDLDLSIVKPDGYKIGWDSSYKDGDNEILFSGDMTDAKNGASELFYLKNNNGLKDLLLHLNYYNYDENVPVLSKFIIAQEQPEKFGSNYMVNPNNILVSENINIENEGYVMGVLDDSQFYLYGSSLGSNVTSDSDHSEMNRQALINRCKGTLTLNYLLNESSVKIIDKYEEGCIDLSPHNLDKNSILELIT